MIQLTWLELLFIFFTALLGGSVLFSFNFRGYSIKKHEGENQEEELIDKEAQKRLRQYDLNETAFEIKGKYDDQIAQLHKKIQELEDQILQLKENKPRDYHAESHNNISLADEPDCQEEESTESVEEDPYLQAREEMELALFKAGRQLTRYEQLLQDQNRFSSAEENSNQSEQSFRDEFAKRSQVIAQLEISFQKNPHTSFSLQQLKHRLLNEMNALSEAAENLQSHKV